MKVINFLDWYYSEISFLSSCKSYPSYPACECLFAKFRRAFGTGIHPAFQNETEDESTQSRKRKRPSKKTQMAQFIQMFQESRKEKKIEEEKKKQDCRDRKRVLREN